MQYSQYQLDILDWVQHSRGNAVVDAKAGSGKTTTAVACTRYIEEPSLFCAFNTKIVEVLSQKLRGTTATCMTINSLGHRTVMKALGRVKLDDTKYRQIIYDITQDLPYGAQYSTIRASIGSIVSFAQSTLCEMDNDSLMEMIEHYTIDLDGGMPNEYYLNKARQALDLGEAMAQDQKVISFNDQIWLPNKWGLQPQKYPFVIVDEAQDLSRSKLELVLSARQDDGRILCIGDPNQAIYGFAGADPSAWQRIIDRTNAVVLPLSVCYRCPTSHIERAQKLVPSIEAAPGAAEGSIVNIKHNEIAKHVQPNDMIICRTTAPLIKTCLELIALQIPAKVAGRDIGKSLVALAKEAEKYRMLPGFTQFPAALSAVVEQKIEALRKTKNSESKVQSLEDRSMGLMACFDAGIADSYPAFYTAIEQLFNDQSNCVTLSTCHKAKGLECERVFILYPDLLMKFGKQEWEREQERNLAYVSYTRALDTLYLAHEAK